MLVFGEGVLEALGDVSVAERVDAIVDGLADESCPAEYFIKRRDPDIGWRVFAARRIPAKRVLAVYGGVIRLEGKPNGTHEVPCRINDRPLVVEGIVNDEASDPASIMCLLGHSCESHNCRLMRRRAFDDPNEVFVASFHARLWTCYDT